MNGRDLARLGLALAGLAGCGRSAPPPDLLADRTAASGVDFVYRNGAAGKKLLPEINGGCAALLDYDGDGRLDLYFGQGQPMPGADPGADWRDRLYQNLGGFRFEDVTDATGASEDGYTYHAAAPDVEGDGDPDLYLSNLGPNRWLVLEGKRFVDRTDALGGANPHWSAVSAFADFDRDGDLDLYVGNYCVFPLDHAGCGELAKGEEWRAYCNPKEFPGAPDCYYRNEDGRFVDRTAEVGMEGATGTALGLVPGDYDDDGDVDLFVANDGRPNFLWLNDSGRFRDVALRTGVAVGAHGLSEACMGTDFGDTDLDGDFDLIVANLSQETNTFYRNAGGLFEPDSTATGLGPPSLRLVGFGCEFFDVDQDADPDLMVANGHVLDNVELYEPSETYRQPPQLYLNDGRGVFREAGASFGAFFHGRWVGRGLVTGDLDEDGDLDVVVCHNDRGPTLLENRVAPGRSWVRVKVRGSGRNVDALGARVVIEAGGRVQRDEVRGTSSYGSWQDLRVHFGLGDAERVERLEVRWPDGRVRVLQDLPARTTHTVAPEEP